MGTFIEQFFSMFSYQFMVRATIVGILISLCASLLGVSMVLKRYSMIGDGLSHVGFGALAIAAVLNIAPLIVAIPVVIIAAFLLLRISEQSKIKGDAAIAMISSGALAIGVMAISISGKANTDLSNYMFGSILSISSTDAVISIVLAVVVLALFIIFYNRIFAVTFDESFSMASGTATGAYNMLLALLAAITIVIGMRMMGTLLISSLVIFPCLTAMRVYKRFLSVVICSGILSVVCFLLGMTCSYFLETPTGASIVVVNIVAFIVFFVIGRIKAR